MTRLLPSLLALATTLTACAVNLGGPRNIPLTAVGVRAADGTSPGAVAQAVTDESAEVALVVGPADTAWFADLAAATELTLSGPGNAGDFGLGFLAGEPLGDTTVVIQHDEGSVTLHDALYDLGEERFLDLMAFQIDDAGTARPAMRALLEYVATDVMNSAAVVIAVAVPSPALGDSVARMLSPAYFDALRCDSGLASREARSGLRLFYGPEARVFCTGVTAGAPAAGELVRASLVLGRR